MNICQLFRYSNEVVLFMMTRSLCAPVELDLYRDLCSLLNKPVPCTNLYGIDFYKMTPL